MRKSLKLSILPKKPLKRLRASLENVLKQLTDDAKKIRGSDSVEQSCKATWEIAIREAFLRYFFFLYNKKNKYINFIDLCVF